MKLNNVQINALVDKIYDELKAESVKYKESPEYLNYEGTLTKTDDVYQKMLVIDGLIKELNDDERYHKVIGWYGKYDKCSANYLERAREKAFEAKSVPSRESIKQEIVLATIEEPDSVEALINSVKNKFVK